MSGSLGSISGAEGIGCRGQRPWKEQCSGFSFSELGSVSVIVEKILVEDAWGFCIWLLPEVDRVRSVWLRAEWIRGLKRCDKKVARTQIFVGFELSRDPCRRLNWAWKLE